MASCHRAPERAAWLKRLPNLVGDVERRWSLTLGPPFDGAEVSAAWVAPATRADGTSAVLKLGMPHMEGEHEIESLRFWDGDPRGVARDRSPRGQRLAVQREPWLVVDPKPFVGDPAYDATQHLFNCLDRLRADPTGTTHRFADLVEVDRERVRLWMFARAAAESRDVWDEGSVELARTLAAP